MLEPVGPEFAPAAGWPAFVEPRGVQLLEMPHEPADVARPLLPILASLRVNRNALAAVVKRMITPANLLLAHHLLWRLHQQMVVVTHDRVGHDLDPVQDAYPLQDTDKLRLIDVVKWKLVASAGCPVVAMVPGIFLVDFDAVGSTHTK